ncbi:hypothetical protein [Burkholderia pseudomallei]|uniref:hypothetical protein n=1 Tax=Burkholderia pseudomallei TaxID=28450 RepID=UPI0003468167|nr:hypothetical protein [Burkholderia pseudomallei]MBR7786279.1 hypothetical protein [Burkholderia pseudomallei]OMU16586.1 hypothetical protein AQ771_02800 [Burkholderia pseudomallei]OMU35487.1 hypothetical protein AQ774_04305 [Burkholderia pseudomallei]OMU37548.1 hypothetical protein AQ772_09610 [Burkholderia pseudomallei]OMU42074.1 hypothetical protein AQ775_25760 [Burkholderia pseudomallei]
MRARRAPNPSGPRTRRAIQQACAKPRRRTIRCARRVHTPWFVNHHHDNPSRDDGFALVGSERHPALLVLPLMGVGYAVAEMIENGGVIIGGSAGIANDLAEGRLAPGFDDRDRIASPYEHRLVEHRLVWARPASHAPKIRPSIDSNLALGEQAPELER